MHYMILTDHDRTRLCEDVGAAMESGWEVAGGVAVYQSNEGNFLIFAQALTLTVDHERNAAIERGKKVREAAEQRERGEAA